MIAISNTYQAAVYFVSIGLGFDLSGGIQKKISHRSVN